MIVFAQPTHLVLNVFHAQPQELGTKVQINAFVQLQPTSGTETPAFAQPTHLDLNAFHAQPQEAGISAQTNVFALHQPMSGMAKHVFAHQIHSAHHAKLAPPQDSGTTPSTNVCAPRTESGTVKTVFALQDCSDQTVLSAHLKSIGTKRLKPASVSLLLFGAENTASAHHQQPSTMVQNVPAQLELMDPNASHVPPQDSGTII
jgi:hypothetical protein